jgi:mRNA interferase MazF
LTSEIGKFDHIIISFISSKHIDDLLESDIVIRKNSKSFVSTGLYVDSVIRLHKMITILKYIIKRRLGVISKDLESEIKQKLRIIFESK